MIAWLTALAIQQTKKEEKKKKRKTKKKENKNKLSRIGLNGCTLLQSMVGQEWGWAGEVEVGVVCRRKCLPCWFFTPCNPDYSLLFISGRLLPLGIFALFFAGKG